MDAKLHFTKKAVYNTKVRVLHFASSVQPCLHQMTKIKQQKNVFIN